MRRQAEFEWLETEEVPGTAIGGIAVSLIAQPEMADRVEKIKAVIELRQDSIISAILSQHITEQCPLLNRIIQCTVRVRIRIKPSLRHIALHALTVARFHHRHGIGLDVKRGKGEWTF